MINLPINNIIKGRVLILFLIISFYIVTGCNEPLSYDEPDPEESYMPGDTIVFTNITSCSLNANWYATVNETMQQESLSYKLVKDNSSASNIDTVGEADSKTGEDLILDWSADILEVEVTGLDMGREYYFTLMVKDETGNTSLYEPVSVTTCTIWQKMIGGSGFDLANSIKQTSDGGYIIAGYSNSQDIAGTVNHGLSDYYIVKLDSNGNIEWQKMYGDQCNECAESVCETNDGGYIIAGYSEYIEDITDFNWKDEYAYYVIKLDNNGDMEWQRAFGGSEEDKAKEVLQTSDGGFIVAGYSKSKDIAGADTSDVNDLANSICNCYIVKLNSSGNLEWHKLINLSDGWGAAFTVDEREEGGYIVAGNMVNSIGGLECYFIKLDKDGNVENQYANWSALIDESIISVLQTSDGSYIGAGESEQYDGSVIVLKLNSGITDWQKEEYFGGNDRDSAYSIKETVDDGFIVAGNSKSTDINDVDNHGGYDYYIFKIDHNLDLLWQYQYGGGNFDSANSIEQTSDRGYIVAGETESTDIEGTVNHGEYDFYILKLNSIGTLE